MRLKKRKKIRSKNNVLSLITLGAILIPIALFLSGLIQSENVLRKYTWPKPGETAMFGGNNYVLYKNGELSVNESSCTENEHFIGKWSAKNDSLFFDYLVNNRNLHLGFKVYNDSIVTFDKEFICYLIK